MSSTSAVSLVYEYATSSSASPPVPSATTILQQALHSKVAMSSVPKVEEILANIPFFCIGVITLTVFIIILVMRRLNACSAYILSAGLIAFTAAALDVGIMLTRRVFALRVIREMGYATSIGLRLLFFTSYLASLHADWSWPRNRSIIEGKGSRLGTRLHIRRGSSVISIVTLLGEIVTLGGIVATVANQLIWRLESILASNRLSFAYRASAYLELGVGGLLMSKLVYHGWALRRSPHTLFEAYGPVAAALLLDVGVAMGNIFLVGFSETPQGRMMQATEMAIVLITLPVANLLTIRGRWNLNINDGGGGGGGGGRLRYGKQGKLERHRTLSFHAVRLPSLLNSQSSLDMYYMTPARAYSQSVLALPPPVATTLLHPLSGGRPSPSSGRRRWTNMTTSTGQTTGTAARWISRIYHGSGSGSGSAVVEAGHYKHDNGTPESRIDLADANADADLEDGGGDGRDGDSGEGHRFAMCTPEKPTFVVGEDDEDDAKVVEGHTDPITTITKGAALPTGRRSASVVAGSLSSYPIPEPPDPSPHCPAGQTPRPLGARDDDDGDPESPGIGLNAILDNLLNGSPSVDSEFASEIRRRTREQQQQLSTFPSSSISSLAPGVRRPGDSGMFVGRGDKAGEGAVELVKGPLPLGVPSPLQLLPSTPLSQLTARSSTGGGGGGGAKDSTSASVKSDFTLSRFPSPPSSSSSPYTMEFPLLPHPNKTTRPPISLLAKSTWKTVQQGQTLRLPPVVDQGHHHRTIPLEAAAVAAASHSIVAPATHTSHDRTAVDVDGVQFVLHPPTMNRAFLPGGGHGDHHRNDSYPTTTTMRGIDSPSSFPTSPGSSTPASGGMRTFDVSDGRRVDVTSFIRGLTRFDPDAKPGGAKVPESPLRFTASRGETKFRSDDVKASTMSQVEKPHHAAATSGSAVTINMGGQGGFASPPPPGRMSPPEPMMGRVEEAKRLANLLPISPRPSAGAAGQAVGKSGADP